MRWFLTFFPTKRGTQVLVDLTSVQEMEGMSEKWRFLIMLPVKYVYTWAQIP